MEFSRGGLMRLMTCLLTFVISISISQAAPSNQDPENLRLKYLVNYPTTTTVTGKTVTVAIIDSGVSLPAALQENVLDGWDTFENHSSTQDKDGHGTAVAGIVLELAPNVRILPMRAFSNEIASQKSVMDAFVRALELKADIVNCSCSFTEEFLKKLRDNVGKDLFQRTLLVFAGGNDGAYAHEFTEAWGNVLIVGASSLTSYKSLPGYSRKGPGIDVVAPAGDINDGIATYALTGDLRLFNGTSAAAPVVSSAAALLKEMNPAFTGEELKSEILRKSCSYDLLKSSVKEGRTLNVGRLLGLSSSCKPL
ncbi:S8 family peptidase [Bdellovibrio sp. HCB337]|uniref:S8 family peptidase n=1 Tax=Bdellovibrio sp. HCB337 TaxID=3394358 RepID=UPI0039A6C31A